MTEGLTTLADLRKVVENSTREIERSFTSPDDDWVSMLIVQMPGRIAMIELPPQMFEGRLRKDLLGETIRSYVAGEGAYRYALVVNTFMAIDHVDSELMRQLESGEIRVRDVPGRVEALVLVLGDAETEEVWVAEIERSTDRPPRLRPFAKEEDAEFSGRFIGLNSYLRQPQA